MAKKRPAPPDPSDQVPELTAVYPAQSITVNRLTLPQRQEIVRLGEILASRGETVEAGSPPSAREVGTPEDVVRWLLENAKQYV